jgi:MFS transporter, DHA2 family, multidrug resistance protein
MTPDAHRAWVLATCTAVTFLYSMSITAVNVSLPQIQGALSATPDQIAWVVTSNLVATAVATPLSGWLAARLGWRTLCAGCVAGFTIASAGCGLAGSFEALVAWRAAQGAFGAPLVPVSQAIVLESYPRERHGAVIAVFGMGSVLGPVLGPVLGGELAEAYNWRWVFYMMVPFSVVALFGCLAFIRDRAAPQRVSLDWTGFLMLSAALAGLQLMLDRGERANWFSSMEIVAWAAVAALGFYLFVAHTLTHPKPFLSPQLLRERNFALGLVLIFVFGMLNFTPMTLLPALLQGVAGYPDSVIGWVIGARGLGTLVGFSLMIYASRLDPRLMIAVGFLLQALAGWQLAQLDPGFGLHDVFWPMAVQGFGVGILWVPITMVAFSEIGGERLAEGTAVYHMLRNIGSSVHISLSAVLAVHMTQASHAELTPNVSPFNEALLLPWVRGTLDPGDPQSLAAIEAEISRQAFMLGYLDAFWAFSATALVVLPLIALVRWKRAGAQ